MADFGDNIGPPADAGTNGEPKVATTNGESHHGEHNLAAITGDALPSPMLATTKLSTKTLDFIRI